LSQEKREQMKKGRPEGRPFIIDLPVYQDEAHEVMAPVVAGAVQPAAGAVA
jgi:hypothetical protein